MKKDVGDYIARCIECQRVNDNNRHPVGLLHPLPILDKKWEVIKINFITKFPKIARQHDSIMVLVDKLSKASHFVHVKTIHMTTNIAKIYMKEIARLHGIPRKIVSDRDTKFTSNFWKGLSKGFGTNINFSTIYHP
jgi:hypothetical protein